MTVDTSRSDLPQLLARAVADAGVSILLLDELDRTPRIVFASAGFEGLTGYSADETIGMRLDVLTATEEGRAALTAILSQRREGCVTLKQLRRDGTPFWADLRLTPVSTETGSVYHYLCVQLEATERIVAEAALQESLGIASRAKRDWESTVDSLADLVLLVDGDMRIVRANRTLDSWGLGTVTEVNGSDLHQTLHPDCADASCYLLDLWRRLRENESGDGAIDCNVRDEALDKRVQVAVRSTRQFGPTQRRNSAILIVRDVSESHQEEEQSRRRDRFEAMGRMVAGLAHEIGNPVAAMKTTVEVWERNFDRFDREAHLRYLARLQEGVVRLQATVDRILRRDHAGPDQDREVRLAATLERARALFEDQAAEQEVDLVVGAGASRDPGVLGDPVVVDEVLTNIVKNAMEACRPGDQVTLDMRSEGNEILIEVRDTGTGVNRSDMRNLFIPFFTTKPTGTGIGLAHANRLMEEMGGRIEIASVAGEGTVVTLRFQRAAPGRAANEMS